MTTVGQSNSATAANDASQWDAVEARRIMETYRGLDGALMPILHALQERFGYVDDAAVPDLANLLNLSRAEVHGVITFYHDFRRTVPPPNPLRIRAERGLIHATRYAAGYTPFARTDSVHRQLFRFAYANQLDLLIQSEPEEMALLTGYSQPNDIEGRIRDLLIEIYQAEGWDSLVAYWQAHGRLYFDVDSWARGLDAYDYVLGTRLHGTIMALNSGVPGVLIHHDSRTREMAEFAAIPSIDAKGAEITGQRVRNWVERADYAGYYARREANRTTYRQFLERNGLVHTLGENPSPAESI